MEDGRLFRRDRTVHDGRDARPPYVRGWNFQARLDVIFV